LTLPFQASSRGDWRIVFSIFETKNRKIGTFIWSKNLTKHEAKNADDKIRFE